MKEKGKIIFAKLDAFFFGNRKIVRAGRNGREVFLFALCMNAQRGAQGWIPLADLEPWYIAYQLQISEADAKDGVTSAVTAGLLQIEGGRVSLLGWNDDWARLPLSRAEIQANYRKRQENAERNEDARYRDEVTSDHQGNALPIRVEESRSERVRGNDSLSLSGEFAPSQKAREIAATRNLDLVHELAQFRDHAESAGWTSKNWDASFCKWLRNSKDVGHKAEKPKAKPGRYVTKQRTADGVSFVLTETDGNSRVITEEEAKEINRKGTT